MTLPPFGRRLLALPALALLLALGACDLGGPGPGPPAPPTATSGASLPPSAPAPTAPEATAPPASATPASNIPRGGTLTLRIARDVTTLNPLFVEKAGGVRDEAAAQVTGLIFSGLTRLDDQLRPQPDLAERWDVAPDGLSILFTLRPNARWQDGQPVTASDVIWTYNTWLNLTGTTTLQYHLRDAVLQIKPDNPPESTVRFWLKKPYAPILADLAAPILPRHLLANTPLDKLASDPFNFKPVGSGPFMFSEHKEGENVTLTANPDYYGGAPYLSRVAFLVAPDTQVALAALGDGRLSLAEAPQAAWEDYAQRPGIQNLFTLAKWTDPSYYFIAFNTRQGHALSDVRLRQAWALALDKESLVRAATGGAGAPVWSDIDPASWAYAPDTPRLNNDPARARQLLADGGWRDTNGDGIVDKAGEPLRINLYVRADDPARLRVAAAMGPPLAAVGISTTVAPVDFDSVISAKIDPNHQPAFDFHAMIMGWENQSPDPDDYALFHSSQIRTPSNPNGLNYIGYNSPEYDDLSFRARGEYDFSKRAALYAQIQKLLATDLPYYPLWADQHFMILSRRVQGPINLASPRYLWNVEKWWIAPSP
jgi:peptide/nickel transport system substrate-binding protein